MDKRSCLLDFKSGNRYPCSIFKGIVIDNSQRYNQALFLNPENSYIRKKGHFVMLVSKPKDDQQEHVFIPKSKHLYTREQLIKLCTKHTIVMGILSFDDEDNHLEYPFEYRGSCFGL
jgi:hypothetical protein